MKRVRPKPALTNRSLGRKKVWVTLRIDKDVLARFKAAGPGWQTRMNDALRQAAGL